MAARISNCKIGLRIRKIERVEIKLPFGRKLTLKILKVGEKKLDKQMRTFSKKLRPFNVSHTEYVIEKDDSGNHHAHMIVSFWDPFQLNIKEFEDHLIKLIGGKEFLIQEDEKGDPIYFCSGRYGEVVLHRIYNEYGFSRYINKREQSKTFWVKKFPK